MADEIQLTPEEQARLAAYDVEEQTLYNVHPADLVYHPKHGTWQVLSVDRPMVSVCRGREAGDKLYGISRRSIVVERMEFSVYNPEWIVVSKHPPMAYLGPEK